MEDCEVCGGPAPTSPDDSSHDECTFDYEAQAKAEIEAEARNERYFEERGGMFGGFDSWMEAAYEDQFAL